MGGFRLKTTTRTGLVVKNGHFSPENGDEIDSRRQKQAFLTLKRRRDSGSSPKNSGFHQKTVTRFGLVVKIEHSPPQNGDENRARRQKIAIFTSKW